MINDEEQLLRAGLLGEHRLHRSLGEMPPRLGVGANDHCDVKLTANIVPCVRVLDGGLRLDNGQSGHLSSARLSAWLATAPIA